MHSPGKSSGETEVWITQGPIQILTPITQPAAGILLTWSSCGRLHPLAKCGAQRLGWLGLFPAITTREGPSAGHCSQVSEGQGHEIPSQETQLQSSALKDFSLSFPDQDGGDWVR